MCAFLCLITYLVYYIIKEESERVCKQDAAYQRYLEDNEKAGNIFPEIDISTKHYFILYDSHTYSLEEWEEDNHEFSQHVSNHKNYSISNVDKIIVNTFKPLTLGFILMLSSCYNPYKYTAIHYCNSVNEVNGAIELTTIYRGKISVVEVKSISCGITKYNDKIGGIWRLDTYMDNDKHITIFKYRLIIDEESDYSDIKYMNSDNYIK